MIGSDLGETNIVLSLMLIFAPSFDNSLFIVFALLLSFAYNLSTPLIELVFEPKLARTASGGKRSGELLASKSKLTHSFLLMFKAFLFHETFAPNSSITERILLSACFEFALIFFIVMFPRIAAATIKKDALLQSFSIVIDVGFKL